MSNLTVSVDEHLIKLARMRAIEQGTSLSAKVREFLQAYVIGYGCGGVAGVLAGGAVVSWLGFEVMYGVATVLAVLATLCAWRTHRLEGAA